MTKPKSELSELQQAKKLSRELHGKTVYEIESILLEVFYKKRNEGIELLSKNLLGGK